ncbi:porin [Vibrio sp. Y2-5]|uniref:porin n=1 Tax=Vibrio TaxID=662 RepID=UPI00142DB88E|nr:MULTISPECIES: porin [Vibrio]MBD0786470.1 porin [Vibrio sp. Y2-5]NIY94301.1 porin [Vibrio diazotrophicus]
MNIKPLAAVVSLLAAGSVAAGEIYATDTNTVELSGWAKAVGLYVNADQADKSEHVFTDAHLKAKATHFLNEETKVIGSFAINTGDSASDRTAKFEDIKLEFDHTGLGNLSLGDTGNSFGAIEKAKTGEGANLYIVGQGGVNGQGIRYKKTIDKLELSANYETDSESSNESNYGLSANYKADNFSAAIAYGSDGDEADSIGVAADLTLGSLKLAAGYISFENATSLKANDSVELKLDLPNDGETYSVAATYTIDLFRIYGSVQYAEGDYQGTSFDAQTAYLGLGYDVTKEFKTDFVLQNGEIEKAGVKEDGSAVKFVAKYSF